MHASVLIVNEGWGIRRTMNRFGTKLHRPCCILSTTTTSIALATRGRRPASARSRARSGRPQSRPAGRCASGRATSGALYSILDGRRKRGTITTVSSVVLLDFTTLLMRQFWDMGGGQWNGKEETGIRTYNHRSMTEDRALVSRWQGWRAEKQRYS